MKKYWRQKNHYLGRFSRGEAKSQLRGSNLFRNWLERCAGKLQQPVENAVGRRWACACSRGKLCDASKRRPFDACVKPGVASKVVLTYVCSSNDQWPMKWNTSYLDPKAISLHAFVVILQFAGFCSNSWLRATYHRNIRESLPDQAPHSPVSPCCLPVASGKPRNGRERPATSPHCVFYRSIPAGKVFWSFTISWVMERGEI